MFRISVRLQALRIVSVLFCALALLPAPALEAQTFSTLFSFNEEGGWAPYAGVTRDHAGISTGQLRAMARIREPLSS
jgi:hypothetical protein